MQKCKILFARLLSIALFSSFIVIPHPSAIALAPGGDVYIFLGDESGTRYFAKSNNNGTFGSITLFASNSGVARGGATADFDNDGDLDLASCNSNENLCYLRRQNSPGVFDTAGTRITPGLALDGAENGMAPEDFDQDGHIDFAVGGSSGMRIYMNDGAGDFTFYDPTQPIGFDLGKMTIQIRHKPL